MQDVLSLLTAVWVDSECHVDLRAELHRAFHWTAERVRDDEVDGTGSATNN